MTRMQSLTAILITFALIATSCERSTAPESPPEVAKVAQVTGWSATLTSIEAAGESDGVSVLTADQSALEAVSGMALEPGSIVETDARSRARLELIGGGEVVLNHSTRLELVADSERALRVVRGQVVIALPHDREGGDARVLMPTGEVALRGTKVAVVADETESIVTVTQGQIAAQGEGVVVPIVAGPGQEIHLRRDAAPIVTAAFSLEDALGWSSQAEDGVRVTRGLGTLTGRTPLTETEWPMRKASQKVEVRVQGLMAYTEITEVFKNESGQQVEGVYRFPLPDDAQISRLALKVGNTIMEGEFVENARAERIWRDVVTPRRDPALLRWRHGDQFELRIFPIEPHASRQVTIGYTQRLKPSANGHRYVYPMPYDFDGRIPVDAFSFKAEINGADASHVRMRGYPGEVRASKSGAATEASFGMKNFVATGDLVLEVPEDDDARELRLFSYADPKRPRDDGYAVLALRPNFPLRSDIAARDVIVIADTSYRRQGGAHDVQSRLIPGLVNELDPLDRVQVLACNQRCQAVGKGGWQRPTRAAATELKAAFDAIEAHGSTYPVEALRVAAEIARQRTAKERDREVHIVYLTDGIASTGELDPGRLGDAARRVLETIDARLTLVELGSDGDHLALLAMARGGHGTVVRLSPDTPINANALRILAHIYGASLSDIRVELPAQLTHIYPEVPLALGPGEELVLLARVPADAKTVEGELKVHGQYAGQPFERSYPISITPQPHAGNAFAARLWAEQRIRALELDAAEDHRKEIVRVSTHHGLLSRYTSLLALEDELMMREFNVRRLDRSTWTGKEEAVEEQVGQIAGLGGDSSIADAFAASPVGGVGTSSSSGVSGLGRGDGGFGTGMLPRTRSPAPQPKIVLGSPSVRGALDQAIITRVLRQHRRQMQHCYELALRNNPRLAGRVKIRIVVSPRGDVELAHVQENSMRDASVATCLSTRARRWRFPEPQGGGIVDVVYTVDFSSGQTSSRSSLPTEVVSISAPKPASSAALGRVKTHRQAVERQPDARIPRRSLIRALILAGDVVAAEQEAAAWFELDPLDAEAILAHSQLLAYRGNLPAAKALLASAVDANPRAEWLQERIAAAYAAEGDPALACAQRVAHQSLKRPTPASALGFGSIGFIGIGCAGGNCQGRPANPRPAIISVLESEPPDILSCPMATDLESLGLVGPMAVPPPAAKQTTLDGQLIVELEWDGDADLDIAIVEPNGRLLSWLSPRENVKLQGVRGTGPETLALPRMVNGTYRVHILRHDSGNEAVTARVKVRARNKEQTFEVGVNEANVAVAEVQRSTRYR